VIDALLVRRFECFGDLLGGLQGLVQPDRTLADASRWNRASRSASAATSAGMTLMAALRFRLVSVARHTVSPMPPAPEQRNDFIPSVSHLLPGSKSDFASGARIQRLDHRWEVKICKGSGLTISQSQGDRRRELRRDQLRQRAARRESWMRHCFMTRDLRLRIIADVAYALRLTQQREL
jgi:hypothetical protein